MEATNRRQTIHIEIIDVDPIVSSHEIEQRGSSVAEAPRSAPRPRRKGARLWLALEQYAAEGGDDPEVLGWLSKHRRGKHLTNVESGNAGWWLQQRDATAKGAA
ncbi:MAG: hypothetical protein AB7L17_07195 [Ilumatobacteraceae bacterium]